MIDSKSPVGLGFTQRHHRSPVLQSPDMDRDWYYRWLLFSNFQSSDWRQKTLAGHSASAAMTLVNDDCVCGLCETSGCDVQQSPGTFHRILQALDLNKLPQLLTEETLRQRIGLCKDCEKRIKVLEEAASVRANLKEYFVANLKQLTGKFIRTVWLYFCCT
mgnify:CR=1 FL=1